MILGRCEFTLPHIKVIPIHTLVEGIVLGISLKGSLLNYETHLLEEGCCGSGRLSLKQDVDRAWNRVAQLVTLAVLVFAAFWILAVPQAVSIIVDAIHTVGFQPC